MSQQYQQPTGTGQYDQPYGGRTQQTGGPTSQQTGGMGQQTSGPMGQQPGGGMGQQMGQQMGEQFGGGFHATLPGEFRTALEDFAKVTQIAEWCADLCIEHGPQMAECARACEDLADLADLNEKLIARDSVFGPQVAEAYLQVVQQAIPILQQFQQMDHVSETLSAVTRSQESIERLFGAIGYQSQSTMGGQTQQMGQSAGQMGGPTSQQYTQGPTQQGIGQQGTSQPMGQQFGTQQGPTGGSSFQGPY